MEGGSILDYEQVNRVRREEKSSRLLQKLDPHDFFKRYRWTIKFYQIEIEKAQQDEDSERSGLLYNDMTTIKRRVSEIYALREKKFVLLAALEASGGNPDTTAISKEEKPIYDEFLSIMRRGRYEILEGCAEDDRDVEFAPEKEGCIEEILKEEEQLITDTASPPEKDDVTKEETPLTNIEDIETPEEPEKVLMLATDDILPFSGYKRDYTYRKGDIFTLSKSRAEILKKTKAVVEVGS
ncbi:MAG TPA: hypothetical protein ENN76_03630 [Euryarchaeota archaeon]|mgnify:CR=1 FL=1|nr:hypothetical protein [Euryarchaeota archaeon]